MKTNSELQLPPTLEDEPADGGIFWAWFRLWFVFGVAVILAVCGFLWWERDRAFKHATVELTTATQEGEKWLQTPDLSNAGQIEQLLKDALADKYVVDTSRAAELLNQVHNHHIQLAIKSQLESALECLDSLEFDEARKILSEGVDKWREGDVSQMQSLLREFDDAGSEYNAKVYLFDLSDSEFASLKNDLGVSDRKYSHKAIDKMWASNLARSFDTIAMLRDELAKRKSAFNRPYALEKSGRIDKEEWTIFENKFGTNPVSHTRRGYDMNALEQAAGRQDSFDAQIDKAAKKWGISKADASRMYDITAKSDRGETLTADENAFLKIIWLKTMK